MLRAVAPIVVIAAPAMVEAVTAQNLSLKPVRDPQNRFTIDVPASWNVTTQATKNPSVLTKSNAHGIAGPKLNNPK